MNNTLISRQSEYEESAKQTLLRRVPIVIKLNGASFTRLTKNINKPVDSDLTEIFGYTCHSVVSELQGAVIGYTYSDKFIFILRNDQALESQPWFDNDVQMINSFVTSMVTANFYKCLKNFGKGLVLNGDAYFKCKVWPLPNLTETYNFLLSEQKQCARSAISSAARTELRSVLGKKIADSVLDNKKSQEKIDLLAKHCKINYIENYPCSYRHGTAIYKIPFIVPGKDGFKNKWQINWNTPSFIDEKQMIQNILSTGQDIFRTDALVVD